MPADESRTANGMTNVLVRWSLPFPTSITALLFSAQGRS
jgi:hypothetical protein